jgi:hypothetical protein
VSNKAIYKSNVFTGTTQVAVAPNATITVRRESDLALATIYSDEAGSAVKANPFNADANGYFEFYAAGLQRGYWVRSVNGAETIDARNQAIGTAAQLDVEQVGTLALAVQTALAGMIDLLHVDSNTGHRDMIRGGWFPAFFNQQWGGAPHYFELVDTALGTPRRFEAATGYIDQDSAVSNVADAAGDTWSYQGFKVSKSTTLAAVWVKIYKVGNPANNLECRILPDDGTGKPTGSTAITNGTATAQSGKLHSSDSNGQWVRFVFPTPPSITAGTQYHITLKSSGAVDGTNYWKWVAKTTSFYPHGHNGNADATPTWGVGGSDQVFLVEVAASDESLVSGGIFSDGKLTFFEGASGVLNQSNGRVKDLRDFTGLNLSEFTVMVRGTAWTKDKTILDILYGLDHDRIVLRSNTGTGFAQVDVYDSTGTKRTVTATSVDLSSGNHDIAVRVRAKGDGGDRIDLLVDGAANGSAVTGATFTFDGNFAWCRLGTMWLGGGFAVTPAWTKDTTMATLPSADGWTWSGVATEANAMSVSGGKLYQNRQGYTALQDGYYSKAALSLSNVNGWTVAAKVRVPSNTNTRDNGQGCSIDIYDGAKRTLTTFQEYYIQRWNNGWDIGNQVDMRSTENVALLVGKGVDVFTFFNGRLLVDNTGANTFATGSNQINFGDVVTNSGENSDAVWDYVKYYNTAWLPPQFTGGALSEFAIWNGDLTSSLPGLWNAGTPISVKQAARMAVNHGPAVQQRVRQKGITSSAATTSTAFPPVVPMAEMEAFVVGSQLVARDTYCEFINSTSAGAVGMYTGLAIDGQLADRESQNNPAFAPNSGVAPIGGRAERVQFGLHKMDMRMGTASGTAVANLQRRGVTFEANT